MSLCVLPVQKSVSMMTVLDPTLDHLGLEIQLMYLKGFMKPTLRSEKVKKFGSLARSAHPATRHIKTPQRAWGCQVHSEGQSD